MIDLLKRLKRSLKRIWGKIDPIFILLFWRNSLLASIYYMFFSFSFYREHKAVLAGRAKYYSDLKSKKSSYYRLVRNTHRLEKGLLMKPRRPVFAKDYIAETVESFGSIWTNSYDESNKQFKWAHDVLTEYFNVTGSDDIIDKQREVFKSILNDADRLMENEVSSIPYKRHLNTEISFDDFYQLTKQRRSVRWFLDKEVPRELIDKAILAASQSPSACNRQPFFYRIFDKEELVREVSRYPLGTSGYHHSIKTFIVVVGNLDAYYDERDRHLIYIDASLANMSLMLALETLGLSSCPINWPDFESREKLMDKFLNLEPHQRPIMCLGIGYPDPDGLIAFSEKRELDRIRSYNGQ